MKNHLTKMHMGAMVVGLCLALSPTVFAQQAVAQATDHAMPAMDMKGMDNSMPGMSKPKPKPKPPTKPAPPAASGKSEHEGMDHGSMPGMSMPQPATPAPAPPSPPAMPGHQGMRHESMPGMSMPMAPSTSAPAMKHDMPGMDMKGMDHGVTPKEGSGMQMRPMQGGSAPPNARSPDYSEGVSAGSMRGMDMADNAPLGMLLIEQLEAYHSRDGNGQRWEAQGWYGNDSNKLWVRTEGNRSGRRVEEGDIEAFWNRPFATFWSTQVGLRQDIGEGPGRTWAAVGIQGLAPYWFDVELTAYAGSNGRTAARARASYDLRMTQRLILQPEGEINLYGKDDEAKRTGSGASDMRVGLRMRYEIQRQFAPYIGVNFGRRFGTSADYSRQDQQPVFDRQVVAGVRMWF